MNLLPAYKHNFHPHNPEWEKFVERQLTNNKNILFLVRGILGNRKLLSSEQKILNYKARITSKYKKQNAELRQSILSTDVQTKCGFKEKPLQEFRILKRNIRMCEAAATKWLLDNDASFDVLKSRVFMRRIYRR